MVKEKVIATKKWSYWPGYLARTPAQDEDGLLILGGYDAALNSSKFVTHPMGSGAGVDLPLEIIGLSWQNSARSTNPMPSGYTKINAYIDPYTDGITNMPQASAEGMAIASGAIGNSSWGWDRLTMPQGNLIVAFSNDLQTTIPAADMFRYPTNYTCNGSLNVTSSRVTSYAWYNEANPWPIRSSYVRFGYPLLAQYPLVVDSEIGVFHLANVTKSKGGATASNLKSLCQNISKPPPNPSPVHHKSNTAAIVGGFGIGALLLLAVLFFLFRQHTKKSRAQAQVQPQTQGHTAPIMCQQPEVYSPTIMASPPQKYMQSGVYETPTSPTPTYQPYSDRYSQTT